MELLLIHRKWCLSLFWLNKLSYAQLNLAALKIHWSRILAKQTLKKTGATQYLYYLLLNEKELVYSLLLGCVVNIH